MVKIAVLGAGGGVGQALSYQLRLSPFVDELALYDRSRAAGVAVDLSHIPVKQVIKGYKATENGLTEALSGASIVVLTATAPLPLGFKFTNRNALLEFSIDIIVPLIESCGKICPNALVVIVSSPINVFVPLAAAILRKHDAFDARRLFGVTSLDVVRAEAFLAEMLRNSHGLDMEVKLDVIGGHSAETMVPLFSQVEAARHLSSDEVDGLIDHTHHGGAEVFEAKNMTGFATLSTAYAVFQIVERACRALKGEKGMQGCTFVYMPGIDGGTEIAEAVGVEFFSAKVEFGDHGAARMINPLKDLNEREEAMLKEAVKHLKEDIKLGCELGHAF